MIPGVALRFICASLTLWVALALPVSAATRHVVLLFDARPYLPGLAAMAPAAARAEPAKKPEPKRVLVLHSFGREFRPWSEYARTIRRELIRQSPWPLDIQEHSLITARIGDKNADVPFVEYLKSLYTNAQPDLIVSIGAPAAGFVQRYRQQLFPPVPMVLTAVEQRRVQFSVLTSNDAAVAVRINYLAAFENILRVLPATKQVVVVVGSSPIEKFWVEAIGDDIKPLAGRISVIWTNEWSFEDILKRLSNLPPNSAIFWELMILDAAGVVHEGDVALNRLHAVANAPIFSYDDGFLGSVVGGPMLSVREGSRQTAAVAVRILGGEKAGDIKLPPVQFAAPIFDWREMQRWGIGEARLPAGSEILFRDPGLWEQYRSHVLFALVAVLLQTSLIGWLLFERHRRLRAQSAARATLLELAFMNRRTTVGELSGSIAHEINQPLTAIVTSASAARRWLASSDFEQVRSALDVIENTGHRAADIVHNLRAMFKREAEDKASVDIGRTIAAVLELVRVELEKHDIETHTYLDDNLPTVRGVEIQLQQVVLNLIMNAIEAMDSGHNGQRDLRIRAELAEGDNVRVTIEDSGIGIRPADLDAVFKPMFTTKTLGLGMGLSICRSIIEGHDGRIWASPGSHGGAAFQFELPVFSGDTGKPQNHGSNGGRSDHAGAAGR